MKNSRRAQSQLLSCSAKFHRVRLSPLSLAHCRHVGLRALVSGTAVVYPLNPLKIVVHSRISRARRRLDRHPWEAKRIHTLWAYADQAYATDRHFSCARALFSKLSLSLSSSLSLSLLLFIPLSSFTLTKAHYPLHNKCFDVRTHCTRHLRTKCAWIIGTLLPQAPSHRSCDKARHILTVQNVCHFTPLFIISVPPF